MNKVIAKTVNLQNSSQAEPTLTYEGTTIEVPLFIFANMHLVNLSTGCIRENAPYDKYDKERKRLNNIRSKIFEKIWEFLNCDYCYCGNNSLDLDKFTSEFIQERVESEASWNQQ